MASLPVELLAKYGTAPIPRYTSYPPANHWPAHDEAFAREVLKSASRPISLYVHVPFCRKLCFYCGCNMMVTHDEDLVERYLRALDREVDLVADALTHTPRVVQLHLGGGTPTYLDEGQLERLMASLKRRFKFQGDVETSIEIHPAVTSKAQLHKLAALGFNRVSMGVQDFDPDVQKAVNRIQSFEETRALVDEARALGFVSVNVDLMYGLPLQTVERFDKTLDLVEKLAPDRLALFGFAHMPKLKKHHKLIIVDDLPGPETRLALLERAIERLLGMGYVYVGLDHFAKADDELCRARADKTLRRNFMGYTTCAESDVIALGPSSISEVDGAFLQSEREVRDWAARVEAGHLPTVRGYLPTDDDRARAGVIQRLFCDLEVDVPASTFARELEALVPLARDGLVEQRTDESGAHVHITPVGQLLLRNVAAVFDAYLQKPDAPRTHAPSV